MLESILLTILLILLLEKHAGREGALRQRSPLCKLIVYTCKLLVYILLGREAETGKHRL